jgi:thiosulfate/3-mercaptopyruvate sulfurtransferase
VPAENWIDALALAPHPEGGVYAQTYADAHSTAIYYLLRAGEQSDWHRVAERTEIWHHYAGAPLQLDVSVDGESVISYALGADDPEAEQRPQAVVPPGAWQAAASLGEWTLVGCTVAPPFSFESFELAPPGWQPGAFGPLVSAGWLAEHAGEVALVDVRWYLDGRSGRDAYESDHLPGAVWLDLDAVLADPPSAERGRHPLPTPELFADGLSAAGIGDATPVVAYDASGGMSAARMVWLLRALGHPAALLDGGLAAWTGPLEAGAVSPTPDVFTSQPWPQDRLAELDSVTAARHLLDARSPERYRGDEEPVDPRAGHIPGAANAPWTANLTADGRFAPTRRLREQFALPGEADASQIVVYCGSGVSACHTLLALEATGIKGAKLYPGSWSQWSSDPDRPAVTGPDETES